MLKLRGTKEYRAHYDKEFRSVCVPDLLGIVPIHPVFLRFVAFDLPDDESLRVSVDDIVGSVIDPKDVDATWKWHLRPLMSLDRSVVDVHVSFYRVSDLSRLPKKYADQLEPKATLYTSLDAAFGNAEAVGRFMYMRAIAGPNHEEHSDWKYVILTGVQRKESAILCTFFSLSDMDHVRLTPDDGIRKVVVRYVKQMRTSPSLSLSPIPDYTDRVHTVSVLVNNTRHASTLIAFDSRQAPHSFIHVVDIENVPKCVVKKDELLELILLHVQAVVAYNDGVVLDTTDVKGIHLCRDESQRCTLLMKFEMTTTGPEKMKMLDDLVVSGPLSGPGRPKVFEHVNTLMEVGKRVSETGRVVMNDTTGPGSITASQKAALEEFNNHVDVWSKLIQTNKRDWTLRQACTESDIDITTIFPGFLPPKVLSHALARYLLRQLPGR
jgi:hypothetical protein